VPVWFAIQPHVLNPMAISLLGVHQVIENAFGIVKGTRGKESACGLNHVTRPHKVISAKVHVAFIKAPWNRKTRDKAARMTFGFVHPEHGGAEDKIFGSKAPLGILIKNVKLLLPLLPF